MYVHCPPQVSLPRSSAAQTVDGDLRVLAPGFRSSASPLLGATLRAYFHSYFCILSLCWATHTDIVALYIDCGSWTNEGKEQ